MSNPIADELDDAEGQGGPGPFEEWRKPGLEQLLGEVERLRVAHVRSDMEHAEGCASKRGRECRCWRREFDAALESLLHVDRDPDPVGDPPGIGLEDVGPLHPYADSPRDDAPQKAET